MIAYSYDGKVVARAYSNYINLWELKDISEPIKTISKLESIYEIKSFSFSKNNKFIVANDKKKIYLWNLNTKECKTFIGHTREIISVSFSPSCKHIASCSDDNTIRIWNLELERSVYTLKGFVSCISYSPDDKYIISGSKKNIKIWDLETGECIHTIKTLSDITNISYSPNNKYIVSLHKNYNLYLWNSNYNEYLNFKEYMYNGTHLSFSPCSKYIITDNYIYNIYLKCHICPKKFVDIAFSPVNDSVILLKNNDSIITVLTLFNLIKLFMNSLKNKRNYLHKFFTNYKIFSKFLKFDF